MFVAKISKQLDRVLNDVNFNIACFGSGAYSHLTTNFSYSDYAIVFAHEDFDISENGIDTIVIIGDVNLNKIQIIKSLYNSMKALKKHVVIIDSAKIKNKKEMNLFKVEDFSEYFPIEDIYKKKEVDLESIVSLIKQVRQI